MKVEKVSVLGRTFQAEGTPGAKSQGMADSEIREKLGRTGAWGEGSEQGGREV